MKTDINIFLKREICYVCGLCIERCILDNLRMLLAPCRSACPIHMNCQGYVRLIAQGKDEEGAREMYKSLPFSGIVGRVCHHPCELKCERKKVDGQPIQIRTLKRYLADKYPEIANQPLIPSLINGKKIAIIGSGPAGLMAAYELGKIGYQVTIFDSAPEPGGLLRWGIPSFRLPVREINNSIKMLESMGVKFQLGSKLGRDLNLDELLKKWDAVLLATGAGKGAQLNIPGENFDNIFNGLNLLRETRAGNKPHIGEKVLVIGGGNTAVEAALTCRRLGAKEVSIVCLEERNMMPAFPEEINEATEEGINIINGWGPKEITKLTDNKLQLELWRCTRVFDEFGNFHPSFAQESKWLLTADSIVVAIGQKQDFEGIPRELINESCSSLIINPLTFQTKNPKIFAAGDLASGAKSVIEAMAQGKEAAISIDRYLQGESLTWGRVYGEGTNILDFPIDHSGAIRRDAIQIPRLLIKDRTLNSEIEKTLKPEDARAEAERCLNCGRVVEWNKTCWYCLPCEIECPVNAIQVRVPYLIR